MFRPIRGGRARPPSTSKARRLSRRSRSDLWGASPNRTGTAQEIIKSQRDSAKHDDAYRCPSRKIPSPATAEVQHRNVLGERTRLFSAPGYRLRQQSAPIGHLEEARLLLDNHRSERDWGSLAVGHTG